MKFGKLLAAGQSIMNGRTDISYRSNKQIYLPKFGGDKNPFKTEGEAEAPVAASEEKPDVPCEPEARPQQGQAPASSVVIAVQKSQPLTPAQESGKSWAEKLNPMSIFKAASTKTGAKSGLGPGKGQKPAAMQTELSLDSVRVVHNDLSDVDVEVVPIKSRRVSVEAKPVKSSWEMLGERLFGVEPT